MPERLHGDIIIPTEEIDEAIESLGNLMAEDYRGQEPLVVGLLTGAYVFTTRVVESMIKHEPMLNPSVDFVRVGSYGSGQEAKRPRILGDLSKDTEVKNRLVILTDDITDSGASMDLAVEHMYVLGADDVKVAVMLDRESEEDKPIDPNYIAKVLKSSKWVVGMGLDGPGTGRGGGRTFPYIAECLIQPDNH